MPGDSRFLGIDCAVRKKPPRFMGWFDVGYRKRYNPKERADRFLDAGVQPVRRTQIEFIGS
jgi:hypothetical protein